MRILSRLHSNQATHPSSHTRATPASRKHAWASPAKVARDSAQRIAGLLRPISSSIIRHQAARRDRPFTLRYGIEIEMLNITLQDAAHVVSAELPGSTVVPLKKRHNKGNFDVVDAKGRVWEVKHDYPNLVELATPILKSREDLELVKTIAAALRDADAMTPEHAGLHIHVEAAPFSARKATHMLSFVSQHEWHLFDTLGVHPKRRDECKPLERFPIDRLATSGFKSRHAFIHNYANKAWAGKQRGVNMRNFYKDDGTIEFRYFNATLEAHDLEVGHEFVMALSHHALARKGRPAPGEAWQNQSVQQMCDTLNLTQSTRVALLNSVSPSDASSVAA